MKLLSQLPAGSHQEVQPLIQLNNPVDPDPETPAPSAGTLSKLILNLSSSLRDIAAKIENRAKDVAKSASQIVSFESFKPRETGFESETEKIRTELQESSLKPRDFFYKKLCQLEGKAAETPAEQRLSLQRDASALKAAAESQNTKNGLLSIAAGVGIVGALATAVATQVALLLLLPPVGAVTLFLALGIGGVVGFSRLFTAASDKISDGAVPQDLLEGLQTFQEKVASQAK